MHTVQLLLRPTAYECSELDRRFHAISHIHNVCVSHADKLLVRLEHDNEYQAWRKEYLSIPKESKGAPAKHRKKLSSLMADRRKELGLSKTGFESRLKVCGKRYSRLLSSQQVQAEADRVGASVEKYLFGNGKKVHFKKHMDFQTIGGKSNRNGAKFDRDTMTVSWNGLEMKCYLPKKESSREYILESMEHKISYCVVKRLMFSSGWRYYLELVLDGPAPGERRKSGDKVMGIDPGVSTIAGVSDKGCILTELAPDADIYEKGIRKLQDSMDRSRRHSNPQNYDPNGTVKKGRKTWKYSKNYLRMRKQLKNLYRKKSAYILTIHRELCNRLIRDSGHFLVERMQYKALQKKAKKTEREEKVSEVKAKNGTIRQVHKYKKKKRFGHSINRRAPAAFLRELERKAVSAGGTYVEVDTQSFKASQYDHFTDTCKKTTLKERKKEIGGRMVQRDLYSAFLIKNAAPDLKHPDREKCIYEFERFADMQDALLHKMREEGISYKQCFGF